MTLFFETPSILILALLPIPVIIFLLIKSKKLLALLKNYNAEKNLHASIKTRFWLRVTAWSIAWISLSIALAEPSWGTEHVPVPKSGCAASFVFDVSFSMNAKDAISMQQTTRLQSAQVFAQELLESMPGIATSAVIAKGDGFLAVPLTEDYYSIISVIQALSPYMLSTPGSSIAKGIETAIESFPPQSARNSFIIVFTDGDETDNKLEEAVKKANTYGIHVIFVGFGSVEETEVLAGDGKTTVKTSLKEQKLQNLTTEEKVDFVLGNNEESVQFILECFQPSITFSNDATTTSYEIQPIKRHPIFITIALIAFLFGFLITTRTLTLHHNIIVIIVCASGLFNGCSISPDTIDILKGTYNWNRQNYQESVAAFLEVNTRDQINKSESGQYSRFGLSACYLMQGELNASLTKINEMDPAVTQNLDFARWYNKGIIFHRKGESSIAAFCFKKALLIDSSNIPAKINLEICLQEASVQEQNGNKERIPVKEEKAPPGANNAIFSLIREKESDKWQTQETTSQESNIIDY